MCCREIGRTSGRGDVPDARSETSPCRGIGRETSPHAPCPQPAREGTPADDAPSWGRSRWPRSLASSKPLCCPTSRANGADAGGWAPRARSTQDVWAGLYDRALGPPGPRAVQEISPHAAFSRNGFCRLTVGDHGRFPVSCHDQGLAPGAEIARTVRRSRDGSQTVGAFETLRHLPAPMVGIGVPVIASRAICSIRSSGCQKCSAAHMSSMAVLTALTRCAGAVVMYVATTYWAAQSATSTPRTSSHISSWPISILHSERGMTRAWKILKGRAIVLGEESIRSLP